MKQTTMKRGQFLRELGLSGSALMAFYCMGTTLTACSTGSDDPTPGTGTNTGTGTTSGFTGNADTSKGAISFTLDLTNSNYSKLKTAGEYLIVGTVIVANAKGTHVALTKICTHEGSNVEYRSAQNDLFCNNHGSEFSTTGAVEVGPATKALTKYTAKLSTDGNILTVTA